MNIKSINIHRSGFYGYGKVNPADPFIAKIEVESPFGEVRLNIGAERTKAIIALIADLIAEAGRETANAMTAEVLTVDPKAKALA